MASPPLGALADHAGGLTAARALSLVFMLAATTLLWSAARRQYGRRAAFFGAASCTWASMCLQKPQPPRVCGAGCVLTTTDGSRSCTWNPLSNPRRQDSFPSSPQPPGTPRPAVAGAAEQHRAAKGRKRRRCLPANQAPGGTSSTCSAGADTRPGHSRHGRKPAITPTTTTRAATTSTTGCEQPPQSDLGLEGRCLPEQPAASVQIPLRAPDNPLALGYCRQQHLVHAINEPGATICLRTPSRTTSAQACSREMVGRARLYKFRALINLDGGEPEGQPWSYPSGT